MSDDTLKKKGKYHHGNLRQALVKASLQIIAEEGIEALTLRSVGRRTGVSHAAPYRHFADKEALLAAVAQEGLEELRQAMYDAQQSIPGNPAEQLRAVGLAYVRFATGQPARFKVMFGPYISDRSKHAGLEEASVACIDVLITGLQACHNDGIIRPGEPLEDALLAWSMVHGLSSLLIDRQFLRHDEAFIERMSLAATRMLENGLRADSPGNRDLQD